MFRLRECWRKNQALATTTDAAGLAESLNVCGAAGKTGSPALGNEAGTHLKEEATSGISRRNPRSSGRGGSQEYNYASLNVVGWEKHSQQGSPNISAIGQPHQAPQGEIPFQADHLNTQQKRLLSKDHFCWTHGLALHGSHALILLPGPGGTIEPWHVQPNDATFYEFLGQAPGKARVTIEPRKRQRGQRRERPRSCVLNRCSGSDPRKDRLLPQERPGQW